MSELLPIIAKADFNDRNNFGEFLNDLGLTGIAVEVGTHRGEFAEQLLTQWEGETLYCVDHWLPYDNSEAISKGDREEDYRRSQAVAASFGDRMKLIRESSREAACNYFELESLDFVYLDACHQPEWVRDDLTLWWPNLREGGILAGHDIICPGEVNGGWGSNIQREVFKFAESHQRVIYLVVETLSWPWSFYMVK